VNAPLPVEVHFRPEPAAQADLPLVAEGVQRYLWEGRFGSMLIEVREGRVYVNEKLVEPTTPSIAGSR
jgi:hypothetical protein